MKKCKEVYILMSIQSNINNTIGQAAILASLNPAVQEMSETAKAKRELKGTEKQLEELEKQSIKNRRSDEDDSIFEPVFKYDTQKNYYNKLLDRQQDLSLYMTSKGKEGGRFFGSAYTREDIKDMMRAKAQRRKVEEIQKQKEAEAKAAQEFRSKQIRDLIMNPNLEVNNGTGNDTRR